MRKENNLRIAEIDEIERTPGFEPASSVTNFYTNLIIDKVSIFGTTATKNVIGD